MPVEQLGWCRARFAGTLSAGKATIEENRQRRTSALTVDYVDAEGRADQQRRIPKRAGKESRQAKQLKK